MKLSQMLLMASVFIGCGEDVSLDPERPPTNATDMDGWLESGLYLDWSCEAEAHDARSPSPHGRNRICSNALLSRHEDGEYPVDAASVKEIYDGTSIGAFAVYRKMSAGRGDAFYWYERAGETVMADGLGSAGRGTSACIACHMGAGIDAEHSGHDFVYTQVR